MASDEGLLRGRKIGFLGGGNMAEALIRGLVQGGAVGAEQIRASDLKSERLSFLRGRYGIESTEDNEALCQWADVLVIAVKPQIVDRILAPISSGLGRSDVVISVAAGVPIDAIEARLPEVEVAGLLGIDLTEPVLVVRLVVHDAAGRPVEVADTAYRADRYRYETETRLPPARPGAAREARPRPRARAPMRP